MRIFFLMLFFIQAINTGGNRKVFSGPPIPASCGSPVTAYAMNDGSGSTLGDSSSSGNNATGVGRGVVTWQSNPPLPGTTSFWDSRGSGVGIATSATPTNFTNNQAFTVMLWFQTSDTSPDAFLGNLNAPSTFQGWEVGKDSSGSSQPIIFYMVSSVPSNYLMVSGSVAVNDNVMHIAFVRVQPSGGTTHASGITINIDGTLNTNSIASDTLTNTIASGVPLAIGARQNSLNRFAGPMGFAEIWACRQSDAFVTYASTNTPQLYL